jgi:hypothetical protein
MKPKLHKKPWEEAIAKGSLPEVRKATAEKSTRAAR